MMSFSKLRRIHVIIIGSVLCVLAGVGMFFLVIKPKHVSLQAQIARRDAAAQVGNATTQAQAEQKLFQANLDKAAAQKLLDDHMRKRMPVLDFTRRDVGMIALWHEKIGTLVPMIESFAHDSKVAVSTPAFTLEAPTSNPNDASLDQSLMTFELGQITVMGDFQSIMRNIRRWNECPRLVMVDKPVLSGASPHMTATYTLRCYVFPVAVGGPQIPLAPAAGAAAATPGAPALIAPPTPVAPPGG